MEEATAPYPHHESLTLENFTAFSKASFEFCPGVNVFVGENGTGKTHVLKVLYAVQMMSYQRALFALIGGLEKLFRASLLSELIRRSKPSLSKVVLTGALAGKVWELRMEDPLLELRSSASNEEKFGGWIGWANGMPEIIREPAFIPSAPIIGNTVGFASLYDRYEMDVDANVRHLVGQLLNPRLKESNEDQIMGLGGITATLNGVTMLDGERIYIVSGPHRSPIHLEADGIKVLATLERLSSVGILVPGTCLYWDEPEAHLNPSLMDEVIGAILLLARNGIQVFLATHSYIILKELEVQSQPGDSLRFFAFEKTEDGTKIHEANRYLDIKPNLIEAQYGSLLDRAFAKDFGGKTP